MIASMMPERRPPSERPTAEDIAGQPAKGITCPACGSTLRPMVSYTRPILGGIRRVRECLECGHRIVTTERPHGS